MPISYEPVLARFDDCCGAEEAEDFLKWMQSEARPRVDLSGVVSLHAALLQVMLAGRPEVASMPADPFLCGLLADLSSDTPRDRRTSPNQIRD